MIPFAAKIQWHFPEHRTHRLWLPLFLVWILLLLLLLFPILFVVGIFVRVQAGRLYVAVWKILTSLRKTLVEVESPEFSLKIDIV